MRQLGPFQPFKITGILVGGRDVEVSFTSRFAGLEKIPVVQDVDYLARQVTFKASLPNRQ